jgi:ribosomal 50S subunit-recycling heat shock protein
MKDRNVKQAMLNRGRVRVEGRLMKKVKESEMWSMYFPYMHV